MHWMRSAALAALLSLGVALPCAADGDAAPETPFHVLGASDPVAAVLFPALARRAGADLRRLAEDERRPAPPADRSVALRTWLERYGQVVVNER